MTFPPIVLPGQRNTADRANAGFSIGRLLFYATRDANQSISPGNAAVPANAMSWDNVALDLLGGWSPSQPTRWTPPVPGWYRLEGSVGINAPGSGVTMGTIRGAGWLVNGAAPVASGSRQHASSSIANTWLTAEARSFPVLLNGSTDYVELAGFQDAGAALLTATGSTTPYIAVYYAGPA